MRALFAAGTFAACSGHADNAAPPDAAGDSDAVTPFVIHYVPSSGDDTVAPDVTVSATFNKPVANISSFSFTLTRYDTDSLVAAFVDYDPATRTATLDPQQAGLDRTRTYVATLTPDIVDADGAPLVGTTSWMFSIAPDTTAPTVTITAPAADATNVPVDIAVTATFSEPLANVPLDSFILSGPSGPIAATMARTSNTVTLTPTLQLAPRTTFKATLSSTISDFAGNPLMNAPVGWSFTTDADKVAPSVTTRFPDIDDSEIPLTTQVSVRFSEPVLGVSTTSVTLDRAGTPVPASVTYLPNANGVRLTPAAQLAPSTKYSVTLTSAITDAYGNALPAPVTWDFDTSAGL